MLRFILQDSGTILCIGPTKNVFSSLHRSEKQGEKKKKKSARNNPTIIEVREEGRRCSRHLSRDSPAAHRKDQGQADIHVEDPTT